MEPFIVSKGIVDCTYVRSPCLFVRFCNVFRYEWWVLTATREIEIAESLGFIRGKIVCLGKDTVSEGDPYSRQEQPSGPMSAPLKWTAKWAGLQCKIGCVGSM